MARRARHLTPVEESRRPPRRRSWVRRGLLIALVALTALVAGGDWLVHQPFLRVRHVEMLGLHHETRAQVLSVSGLGAEPPMIDVRGATVARRLHVFPWVASARVTLRWPDTVVVSVDEHRPVAVAYDANHVLQYVDAAGRALGPAPLHANLPTLRYLNPSSRTWPFARAGYNAALVASRLPMAFRAQVSVVEVASSGSVTLQMTTPVTFVLGPPTDLTDKFESVAAVIAHATLQPGDIVDVRAPGEVAISGPSGTTAG